MGMLLDACVIKTQADVKTIVDFKKRARLAEF